MGTIRFFSGGRDPGASKSIASQIMRIEIEKKGKMPSADRFKLILKQKMAENRKKLSTQNQKVMSKRADEALKQIAQKKAAKEAKALRKMVIVTPRVYPNGRLTQKGKIFDVAGNIVAEVNVKNGKIATTLGWSLGKYKPKSTQTHALIQEAINKYSPYYIQQRKLEALKAAGIDPITGQPVAQHSVINVQGGTVHNTGFTSYGEAAGGPRQNVGVTSWGAMSDNVWGTFADNAWGRSMDNVWGTTSTDVWGGIGGNPFGGKGVQIWGTGNGKNYLKRVTNFISALLGIKNKKTVEAFKNYRQATRTTRSAAPTTRSR